MNPGLWVGRKILWCSILLEHPDRHFLHVGSLTPLPRCIDRIIVSRSKHLTVQLPITLIHPVSISLLFPR